jgi:hypothetical protein
MALTVAFLAGAPQYDIQRLWTFTYFSGEPTESLFWLFALGLLLPAYTVTGFDASALI